MFVKERVELSKYLRHSYWPEGFSLSHTHTHVRASFQFNTIYVHSVYCIYILYAEYTHTHTRIHTRKGETHGGMSFPAIYCIVPRMTAAAAAAARGVGLFRAFRVKLEFPGAPPSFSSLDVAYNLIMHAKTARK